MRPIVLTSLLLSSAAVTLGCARSLASLRPPPPAISEARLREHVGVLASDDYRGRGTGEEGIRAAEEYVAARFGEVGLAPLPGRTDYFIPFDLYRRGVDERGTRLIIEGAGISSLARAGRDMRPFPFSDAGNLEAEIVFAGYGITAPEHEHDDYAGLDVTGKLVLLLRHEPGEKDPDSSFDGTETTRHAQFAVKAENAKEHGAAGMLLVTDPLNHEAADDLRLGGRLTLQPPEPPEGGRSEEGEGARPFLAAQVSRPIAGVIVAGSGRSLGELQELVDGGARPVDLAVRGTLGRLAVAHSGEPERVGARDVAGFLEGSDPVLKDEWVVVGGHHDHLGAFSGHGDTVFNGADDNASGTAGVLELARAFASAERPPRRSMVFVTFSAEEKGLLGSKALVDQDLIPLDRVKFMLNLDMIGRNGGEAVDVFGDGHARGLRQVVEAANADVGLALDFGGASYMGASDHDSFYRHDIPFMFFFTGTHEDYHQLGDHVEKLDLPRMRDIVTVARGVLDRVANGDEAPVFVHHVGWLGAQVEVLDRRGRPAAVVTAVEDGSRGAGAGLRVGDVLTAFDDEELTDADRVGERFRGVETGTTVRLAVDRDGGPGVVEVERAQRGYLGIFPSGLDGDRRAELGLPDGEGLLVRQVVDDGPAAQGGLLPGDVMVRLDGQPVDNRSLGRHLARIGAGETVDITVVRGTERRTLEVVLGQRPQRRR